VDTIAVPTLHYGGVIYDRSLALLMGVVKPKGMQLHYEVVSDISELFRRVCADAEFEAAEISLSSLTAMVSRGDDRYIGIPVFPSRCFRHSFVFVRTDRGIGGPTNLAGKLVGVEEYQMTAAVWIRGFLDHDYGVPPKALRWRYGGLTSPGYRPRLPLSLPSEIDIQPIPGDRALEEMLYAGDLDALVTTAVPQRFWSDPRGPVRRLFEDYRAVEREYFQRTGIFPIMHTVALRRDVYEARPETAVALLDAFREAKEVAHNRLTDLNALAVELPWLSSDLEELNALFGGDAFPIGFEPNAHVLATLVRWSYEQGLSSRLVDPHELFAPETL
jgi:4,5-dihydroxyphthalate decarboxylase